MRLGCAWPLPPASRRARVPLKAGHGKADYLQRVNGKPVGVVEAKPEGHSLVRDPYVSLEKMLEHVARDLRAKVTHAHPVG